MDDQIDQPPAPAPTGPAPGWYAQAGSNGLRYWDGTTWTDHVAPGPPPAMPDESLVAFPYFLGAIFGFLPALVISFVRKDAPRTRLHAAQALNIEIVFFGLQMAAGVLWTVLIFSSIALTGDDETGFAVAFIPLILTWLAMMGLLVARAVLYISLGLKTHRGEDPTLRRVPQLVKP